MSHYVTVVLVPKSETDAEAFVNRALAPFDENIEVAPYQRACWCIQNKRAEVARDATDAKFGTIEQARETFRREAAERGLSDEAAREEAWREFIAPRFEYRDAAEKAAHAEPHPACDECHGSGLETTTYNPKSKWDSWRIGGRWDGWIQEVEVESADNGFNFGPEHQDLRNNVRDAEDFKKAIHKSPGTMTPFALLLPDGSWHERGEMGWFGCASNEKRRGTWSEEAIEILDTKGKDCWAVACDLHI